MADDNQKMTDMFKSIPLEELEDIINNKSKEYTSAAIKKARKIYGERALELSISEESITKEDIMESTAEIDSERIREGVPLALDSISTIWNVFGWLTAIGGIIIGGYGVSLILDNKALSIGWEITVYGVLIGLFGFILYQTISKGIQLFIMIEDNTRAQRSLLVKILEK